MQYAVIALTGDHRGYTIKRTLLARRNRSFVGSLGECRSWIGGYKQAVADQETADPGTVTLTFVPGDGLDQAS